MRQTMQAVFGAAIILAAPPLHAQVRPTALERGVLEEINLARTNPARYAGYLRALLPLFRGTIIERPGQPGLVTNEGPRAVQEAIAFLERQAPLPPLALSAGLTAAARDHVRDQGPSGSTGHDGHDGSDPFDRMNRHGAWGGTAAENIAYGQYGDGAGRDVLMQLIIDDGVPSRGHRRNTFAAEARVAGVGCGAHAQYGVMCVIDFAGSYTESDAAAAAGAAGAAPAPAPAEAAAKGGFRPGKCLVIYANRCA